MVSSQATASQPLHLLEGFFGRTWSWSDRCASLPFLKQAGFGSYIYAPKDDPFLRRQWQQDWPAQTRQELQALIARCHDNSLQFGIGLSPFEIYLEFGTPQRDALARRLADLNALGVDSLCLLFDDMRGDLPRLAATQIEIAHFVTEHSTARQFVMCPTYYSTDPILETVFGKRPANYWEDLGSGLDTRVDLFWTGPMVCSTNYPAEHLEWVADCLQRKPFLWDNYPVNDGAKTSRFLNLRAFDGREATPGRVAGHAINPMNQSWLSRIALHSLIASQAADYDPQQAFENACRQQCGEQMGDALIADIGFFQDRGLDDISENDLARLRQRYQGFVSDPQTGPFASELVDWLDGGYTFDPACLTG